MNNRSFIAASGLAALALTIGWIGCGSSSSGGSTTSDGGASATSSTTGVTTQSTTSTSGTTTTTTTGGSPTGTSSSTGAGTGGGGVGTGGGGQGGSTGDNPFQCTVPATPPSAGSCVTVVAMNDAGTGIQCNPVTNQGCQTGEECDTVADDNGNLIGFGCYPPPNDAALCATCDNQNGPFCKGGTTCFQTGAADGSSVCAQYCCSDADCGGAAGSCVTSDGNGGNIFDPLAPTLGICVAM